MQISWSSFSDNIKCYPKKIFSNNIQISTNKIQSDNYDLNLSPFTMINRSCVTFGMSKSEFDGIDLMIAEQLKAPIEKFKTNDDFQKYCQEKLNKKYLGKENIENLSKTYGKDTFAERKYQLNEWINCIHNKNSVYSPSIQLMILSSLTKVFKESEYGLLPNLDKDILAKTVAETVNLIESRISTNIANGKRKQQNIQINFDKLYRTNLINATLKNEKNIDATNTGWVEILSKKNDTENFENNVKKMQNLSHNFWCTKRLSAKPYLSMGNFHIYFDKGIPVLGMRFIDNKIEEIQGEKNNREISLKYLDIAKEHIKSKKYKLNQNAKSILQTAENIKKTIKQLKTKISKYAPNDYEHILPELGINVEKDKKDGLLILSHYEAPQWCKSLSVLGLNENDLFKHVKEISGNADFYQSKITDLGNLEIISGNAFFVGSNVKHLGKLKTIAKDANFMSSKVQDLGCLTKIGGNADFYNSKITNLGNLIIIGGKVDFRRSKITNPGNLKEIGSTINLQNSQLEESDFKNIKTIPNAFVLTL